MSDIKKDTRGGKRPGAGRKSDGIPRKKRSYYTSEEENEAIKELLLKMRTPCQ